MFKKIAIKNLLLFALFFFPFITSGSELLITPPSGVFEVGDNVTVRVMLNPVEYSVNAAEGEILVPQGLTIEEISTENSVFNIWTEEPNLKQEEGIIFFSGGRATPVSNNSEELFSITFKSSKAEIQRLRIASGAVMVADGTGNNVISNIISGVYTFVNSPTETEPQPEYFAPQGSPEKVEISSLTHPDEDTWYSSNEVIFSWVLPEDAVEIKTDLNQQNFTIPSELSEVATNSKVYKDVVDGVWFFHLQIKNEKGWGSVSTKKVQIDTNSPERFWIKKSDRQDLTDPRIKFKVEAEDSVSGVENFHVLVGNIYEEIFSGSLEKIEVGPLSPGSHTLLIRAQDRAGNIRTESFLVQVDPIKAPVFTEVPSVIHSGSIMALKGESLPDSEILVSLEMKGEEPEVYSVRSDKEGIFVFVAPKKPLDGIYKVSAKVIDERGAESLYNEGVAVAVQPPGFIRVGGLMINSLSVLIPLLALVAFLVFVLSWGRHRWKIFRYRLNKEIKEAEEEVHETFENLRKKNSYQLSLLKDAEKRRKLTEEELKIKEQLKETIEDLGATAEKEVHDIKEAFDR
jgi:hypothetical protein